MCDRIGTHTIVEFSGSTSHSVQTGTSDGTAGGYSVPASWNTSTQTSDSLTATTNWALKTKPAVEPSDLTSLPPADPRRDVIRGCTTTPVYGTFFWQTDFVHRTDDLPPAPEPEMPRRPEAEGVLLPWDERACRDHLKLTLEEDLMEAIRLSNEGLNR